MLLNILRCIGQPHCPLQTKNYLGQNVHSAEVEKHWLGPIRIPFRVEMGSGPSKCLAATRRKDDMDAEKAV